MDIPQPHPDCHILYVMGYKTENPAHNFGGSRPAFCVGVDSLDLSAAADTTTPIANVLTVSCFLAKRRTAPTCQRTTQDNVCNTHKVQDGREFLGSVSGITRCQNVNPLYVY